MLSEYFGLDEKLREIKIICISEKKKFPTRDTWTSSHRREETKEFRVSHDRKGSPAHLKTLNGPNHEPVVPFEGTSLLSRETLHRAPTRFTVCFLSKSKPGERPLERRSITRHNKHRCPSISALVSLSSFLLYFIAGMARRDAANKDRHTNRRQMTMENRLPRDRILRNSNHNFVVRIHSRVEFPTNGEWKSINSMIFDIIVVTLFPAPFFPG